MPNYVKNKVTFSGLEEDIRSLREFMEGDNGCFDFEKLIPMPKDLMIDSGGYEEVAAACAQAYAEGKSTCKEYEEHQWMRNIRTFKQWAEMGEKYRRNKEWHGFTSWYSWRLNKWGTKWNACDPEWTGSNELVFSTAWSAPEPIYRALARKFPQVHFDVIYADEDLGRNCGGYSYDGEFFGDLTITGCDLFDFACMVWGLDPDEERAWREEE